MTAHAGAPTPGRPRIDLTGRFGLWVEPELRLWRAAMTRALGDVDPSMAVPLRGDGLLRQALADRLGFDAARLVVTAGVRAAAAALCHGRRGVILERPTFLGVRRVLRTARLPVRLASWDDPDVLDPPAGHTVWLTTPCRNPDGMQADPEFLAALQALASTGRRVVCNTTYRWFAAPARPATPPGLVTVGSLHKLAGPGARLGWVHDPAGLDHEALRQLAAAAPPLHWQRAWGYFLNAGGLSLLKAHVARIASLRRALVDAIGIPDGSRAGPNMLLPVGIDERKAVSVLASRGIDVTAGTDFSAPHASIRLCIHRLAETELSPIVEALDAVVRDAEAA